MRPEARVGGTILKHPAGNTLIVATVVAFDRTFVASEEIGACAA
jgi:hypothetical protein